MSKSKYKKQDQFVLEKKRSSSINWNYIIIVFAIGIFIFSCLELDLTQDDAYISFRYAANYLRGEGLVYNHGERVEGYTNFLWVMLMVVFKGVFNIDYFTFSRFAGVISGTVIFYLLYVLLKHHHKKVPLAVHISLAAAMLCNLSLPYWSIAGLETSAFACMVLAAVVAEYRRPQLTPALLIIATLLRPEGAVVFGVVLINRFITERKIPWHYVLLYVLPLLPFAIFKLAYYGSLFPNPYYAKSGVGLEYIESGLEYLWYFTRTVGVYGIVFLVPLLTIKRLWNKYSLLYVYVILYIIYIVWVGGDVLKVYRFFVPVVPVLYFLFIVSLAELLSLIKFHRQRAFAVMLLCTAIFSFFSYLLSREHVFSCRTAELGLIDNMHYMSTMLKRHMGSNFSLAASTIGMAGYQLLGHRVIDMLGLTDTYIARNPEKVQGMNTFWKERRFNSRYLLEQQPDFILFSTGLKPSAPAERALMLHSEFRHNYSTIAFVRDDMYPIIWRRKGKLDMSEDIVASDIRFVSELADGLYNVGKSRFDIALSNFRKARYCLGENFAQISTSMGLCFLKLNMIDSAHIYFRQALMLDSLCWGSRINLIVYANGIRDTAAAMNQAGYIQRLFPWMYDRYYQPVGDFRADEPY